MEHVIPAHIDPTGTSHVGDELNAWLAQVFLSDEEPTIIFPDLATYRCEYGLALGSNGSDRLHPDLPAFAPRNFTIQGNGARIIQTDNTTYYGPVGADGKKTILDPRKRWGTRLLKSVKASNGVIRSLHFTGGNAQVRDSVYTPREDWIGLQLVSSEDIELDNCVVENVWSDFIYLAGNRKQDELCRRIYIHHCYFSGGGRQGLVMNGIDGLLYIDNRIETVRRLVFDAEPTAAGQVTNITIMGNYIDGGALGLMQISAPGSVPVENIVLAKNFSTRSLIIDVPTGKIVNDDGTKEIVIRNGLSILDNIATNEARPYAGAGAMMAIGAWNNVTVTGNAAWLKTANKVPVKVNTASSDVTVEDNDWKIPV